MKSPHGGLLGSAIVFFSLVLLAAGCGGGKSVIRLHVWEGTDSLSLNNAFAEFVIEEGHGYTVVGAVETAIPHPNELAAVLLPNREGIG